MVTRIMIPRQERNQPMGDGNQMIAIQKPQDFFEGRESQMFYVGFLKAAETWIPLCMVSEPENNPSLDTLFISSVCTGMDEVLRQYAERLPKVDDTFVQFLLPEEIYNLLERHGLSFVAEIQLEGGGCDCGCGCGGSCG